jgi:tetratricopeptide (TPR) repeat protein
MGLCLVALASATSESVDWYQKGPALAQLGKYDEALLTFDKAIEINLQFFEAWYNKGFSLDSLNRYDGAIKAYDKAIEINPRDSNVWISKGLTLDNLNKTMKQEKQTARG